MGKATYSNEFKIKVVLESLQRDTTIEKVKKQFAVSSSALHKWRGHFRSNAARIFEGFGRRSKNEIQPADVAELKQVIGDLTMENHVLKKALESWD